MNDKMKNFGNAINRLIAGENFSKEATRTLFAEILAGEQSEIHQGALLAAITAKGPTPAEIAGAWQAIYELDTVKSAPRTEKPLVDNCGTGMDAFKTFNISTCSGIVASAGGVCLARHGARALTSRCGTVDICEALGVDVECSAATVSSSIEKSGIGIFNGMSPQVHPQALFRILSQMSFGSILNIAASLANPVKPRYGVRGVYAKSMVKPVLETMQEIGFEKAIVFHGDSGNGVGGMDELSPGGESFVAELRIDGSVHDYSLRPEKVGLKTTTTLAGIAAGNDLKTEAVRILKVFSGRDKSVMYDTICLNTAPILYIADEVKDLTEGVEKARDIIDSGRALAKLSDWVKTQQEVGSSGEQRLAALLEEV
jgi:anthranilate phosphoribosyltransferase